MAANGNGKGAVMAHDPLADMAMEEASPEVQTPSPESASETVAEEVAEEAMAKEDTTTEETAVASSQSIELGATLSIADVGELRGRLRDGMDLGGLTIHAGDVEQVDAAGIQLLCAVTRDARNQGVELTWSGVSERLGNAVRQLGLEDELAF